MHTMAIPVVIGIALFLFLSAKGFISHHGMMKLIWRFIAGHHLDGKRRTNATYFTRGNRILHETGKASKYAHLPHFQRSIMRIGGATFLVLLTYGLVKNLNATVIALIVFIIIVIALNYRRLENKWVNRAHERHAITPLSEAIAVQFQTTPQDAYNAITIRPNYADAKALEEIGRIILPDWWQGSDMQRMPLESLLNSRLAVETTYSWQTTKHPMYVKLMRAPIAPSLVSFAEKKPIMDNLNDDKVLLGTDGKNIDHYWDLASEEPHMAVQATSRRGKTRLLLLIASQILNKGGSFYGLDPKRVGIRDGLAGIANAYIWDNPRDMQGSFDLVHKVKELLDERIDAYEIDRTVEFKRALLAIDEMSMYAAMTKRYWDKNKPRKAGRKAPFWDDLGELIYMAAFVKINILIFGQRLDQRLLEGLLESFGCRLAAGWNRTSYMRFIGLNPVPVSPKPRGRFLLYNGESTNIIQTVLGTDIELHDYAKRGRIVIPTNEETLTVSENRNE